MELKVWVDGTQRVVCGVRLETTCRQIVFALAHATKQAGRFTMVERWKNEERLMNPDEQPLVTLQRWGEFMDQVEFVIRKTPAATGPPQTSPSMELPTSSSSFHLPQNLNNHHHHHYLSHNNHLQQQQQQQHQQLVAQQQTHLPRQISQQQQTDNHSFTMKNMYGNGSSITNNCNTLSNNNNNNNPTNQPNPPPTVPAKPRLLAPNGNMPVWFGQMRPPSESNYFPMPNNFFAPQQQQQTQTQTQQNTRLRCPPAYMEYIEAVTNRNNSQSKQSQINQNQSLNQSNNISQNNNSLNQSLNQTLNQSHLQVDQQNYCKIGHDILKMIEEQKKLVLNQKTELEKLDNDMEMLDSHEAKQNELISRIEEEIQHLEELSKDNEAQIKKLENLELEKELQRLKKEQVQIESEIEKQRDKLTKIEDDIASCTVKIRLDLQTDSSFCDEQLGFVDGEVPKVAINTNE